MRFFQSKWSGWPRVIPKCQLFGSYCALCTRAGQAGIDLCAPCQSLFKATRHTGLDGRTTLLCPGCGVLQNSRPRSGINNGANADSSDTAHLNAICAVSQMHAVSQVNEYCTDCIGLQSMSFCRIVAPYRYAFPVDAMLKRMKYNQDRQLARVFGTLLARHVAQQRNTDLPQILLPMPLYASRLRERGFNQAQDIARWCGRTLGISVKPGYVSRIADTGSLAGLSRAERQHRILGAFRADDSLTGQRVAIVDDVLTTGASSRELAREVYDSGAESVELWVLARTSSDRAGA